MDRQETQLEQYKAYMADVGNIGVRHENTRGFYLSVVSALFTFLTLAGHDGVLAIAEGPVRLVGYLGIGVCVVWFMHMQSFRAIYRAKFGVLRAIEAAQSDTFFDVFKRDLDELKNQRIGHFFLTSLDSVLPGLLVVLFIALLHFK